MAEFETFGFDELEAELEKLTSFEVNCPECDNPLEISLDDVNSQVTCPHCQTIIEIESE